MIQEEPNIKELLSGIQKRLIKPVTENSQRLLFVVNLMYFPLSLLYLANEYSATGRFVPSQFLGYVYVAVGITNAVSAAYGYVAMSPDRSQKFFGRVLPTKTSNRIERRLRWSSILSIMFLSICFMLGIGNPSSDSLFGDFALAHSLIILVGVLLGQRAALGWAAVVVFTLFFVTLVKHGYSYQFDFLTKAESAQYQSALTAEKPWAVQRKQTLNEQHLNPPPASRYLDMWLIVSI